MNPRNSYLDWQRFVLREWRPLLPLGLDFDKAIRLALTYASYGDYGESVYVGSDTIAKETGIGERTIKRYRSFFIREGILKRTGRKRNRAHELTIGYPSDIPAAVAVAREVRRTEIASDYTREPMGARGEMGGEPWIPHPCGKHPRCDGVWHGNVPCPEWQKRNPILWRTA